MSSHLKTAGGLIGAGFFGAIMALSIAADNPKPPAEAPKPAANVAPRYSAQVLPPNGILILDNQTNKLHTYVEIDRKTLALRATTDLSETGKDSIPVELKK